VTALAKASDVIVGQGLTSRTIDHCLRRRSPALLAQATTAAMGAGLPDRCRDAARRRGSRQGALANKPGGADFGPSIGALATLKKLEQLGATSTGGPRMDRRFELP
jgi:hypothetical protein